MASDGIIGTKDAVADLVLLDTIDEDNVVLNLKNRHASEIVYTNIGNVLVSVNPFKNIPKLYDTQQQLPFYRGRYMYECPPHAFAIAEAAVGNLRKDGLPQCIIIAGESGAGKTEASKKIMQYISAVSNDTAEIRKVNKRLLDSNPVLEAFGNARTLRNYNSSRFGKYLEIYFDYESRPVGGSIKTYLLEKSRVVTAGLSERNFHIFYMLLEGADASLKQKLRLKEPQFYKYLSRTNLYDPVDYGGMGNEFKDKASVVKFEVQNFKEVVEALPGLGMSKEEIEEIFSTISGLLWMGQIDFERAPDASDGSKITAESQEALKNASELLGMDIEVLGKCFLERETQVNREEKVNFLLQVHDAAYTRDSMVKNIYQRLFRWIVQRVNQAIEPPLSYTKQKIGLKRSIGVLDIYGFEIFRHNSFEQFCINYVNEKLQQIFIERTLKAEQEEYAREGIKWHDVEYFDNKGVCELIEGQKTGLIVLLNETSLVPQGNDSLFFEKISTLNSKNKYFRVTSIQEGKNTTRNSISGGKFSETFVVKHYAGEVIYSVDGFVDKNKDMVWDEILRAGNSSELSIFSEMFTNEEVIERIDNRKRPPTASSQFKDQVATLMEALFRCHPHYVRCIKPNEVKSPGVWEEDRVRDQVRYLGLVENVRVRRAGYAFRLSFEDFIKRNKMLTKQTWPTWDLAKAKEGTLLIMNALNFVENTDFVMGKTKIFIKVAKTLFKIEEERIKVMDKVMTNVKAVFKGFQARDWYKRAKASRSLQRGWRGFWQRREKKRFHAAVAIQKNWKKLICTNWIKQYQAARKIQTLPRGILARKFKHSYKFAALIQAVSKGKLQRIWYQRTRGAMRIQKTFRRYVEYRPALMLKDEGAKKLAERKVRRKFSIELFHVGMYMLEDLHNPAVAQNLSMHGDDTQNIVFIEQMKKLTRNLKPANRTFILTTKNIFDMDMHGGKVHRCLPLSDLAKVFVSTLCDNIIVFHSPSTFDSVYEIPQKVEVIARIAKILKDKKKSFEVVVNALIEFRTKTKETKTIFFSAGSNMQEPYIVQPDPQRPKGYNVVVNPALAATKKQTDRYNAVHARIQNDDEQKE